MRVTVISDLHGAVDRLPEAAASSDALVVLGDLINVIDYLAMDGILVEIFGREPVAAAAAHRAAGRFTEARATLRAQTDPELDFRERFTELAPPRIRVVDGEAFELAGLRWGIVGGGVRTPLGVPGEVTDEAWEGKLQAVGDVDVVGTHMPPRVPWYCYDRVAAKFEPGSTPLLRYIQEREPRFALFGHVHQPLVGRGHVGRTELVNVGHFRAGGTGWAYEAPG